VFSFFAVELDFRTILECKILGIFMAFYIFCLTIDLWPFWSWSKGL